MKTPVTDQGDKAGKDTGETVRYAWRYWTVFFLLGLPLLLSLWLYAYGVGPGSIRDGMEVAVIIPGRTGFAGIQEILAENKVIEDDIRFRLLARITGKAQVLKAGEYIFQPGLSPYQVLLLLEEGKVVQRPITIPEGTGLVEIADILAADNWIDRQKFLMLARDESFIQELGLSVGSLEGYLFPDTYCLARGNQDEAAIIRMMAARFQEVYQKISNAVPGQPSLSQHEVLTLASIVEKETGQDDERPLVARVFINRLQKGMRLQADPTVRYGRGQLAGKLTRQDLQTPTPYNTYMIKGLPPGPICNPGRAALSAVLQPVEGDLFYFVSKNDGTHHFSKTLAEHNRAVVKYQR
jgi:UPF0755 protein